MFCTVGKIGVLGLDYEIATETHKVILSVKGKSQTKRRIRAQIYLRRCPLYCHICPYRPLRFGASSWRASPDT